jgi:excisionase family DNA binding protein
MKSDLLTLSVPEAGKLAGIGKNASYQAALRGEIPTLRFGKKLRVPKAKFLRMLSGEASEVIDRVGEAAGIRSLIDAAK